jgi:putative iron-regulated protein
LLVENLASVHAQWQDGETNYRADFLELEPADALSNILLGMGSLAKGELSGERMTVAYDLKDQENEHSCFSDNTKADLMNNALSVQNVLLGRYGEIDGAGIDELVEGKDAALADELREQMQQAIDDIDAIPAPFDTAILGEDEAEGRVAVSAAIDSLRSFAESLELAAQTLGIELKLE